MKNETLAEARRAFDAAKRELSAAILTDIIDPAREAGGTVSSAAVELYYSDPTHRNTDVLIERLNALPKSERTVRIASAVARVIGCGWILRAEIVRDRLFIHRLYGRGIPGRSEWKPSCIDRDDVRILGSTHTVPGDPKTP